MVHMDLRVAVRFNLPCRTGAAMQCKLHRLQLGRDVWKAPGEALPV
jgi:hypothetical protein